MKRIILIIFVTLFNWVVTAQNKDNAIVKTSFQVNGVCGMCKERIEGSLAEINGVKKVNWNVKTHNLLVVFNSSKISLDKIKSIVAETGHDTDNVKATDETYKTLPACCAYRDGAKCNH